MVDFNALRARKGSNFDSLQKKLAKTETGGFKKDERIWKPTANKDAKSSNIIRFLPIPYVDLVAVEEGKAKDDDLTPMAKILSHAFQGSNGWFIENSLQTFGEDCPVRKHDGPLWGVVKKNNDTVLKEVLKKRLPKTTYYANVLVIKDGTNPENNGKVMIYEFGETIRKLIEKAKTPEFDTDVSVDPFDAFEGADLLLNLTYEKKKIGERESLVPKFDNVKWASPSALAGGNETEIERIWKESHSMLGFYDRKLFKTFDELEAKYLKVMGAPAGGNAPAKEKSADEMLKEMTGETKTAEAAPIPAKEAPKAGGSVGEIDELEEFERMLNGN